MDITSNRQRDRASVLLLWVRTFQKLIKPREEIALVSLDSFERLVNSH